MAILQSREDDVMWRQQVFDSISIVFITSWSQLFQPTGASACRSGDFRRHVWNSGEFLSNSLSVIPYLGFHPICCANWRNLLSSVSPCYHLLYFVIDRLSGVALKGATSFSSPSKGKSPVAVRRSPAQSMEGLLHVSTYSKYGSTYISNCSVVSSCATTRNVCHWPKCATPKDLKDRKVPL